MTTPPPDLAGRLVPAAATPSSTRPLRCSARPPRDVATDSRMPCCANRPTPNVTTPSADPRTSAALPLPVARFTESRASAATPVMVATAARKPLRPGNQHSTTAAVPVHSAASSTPFHRCNPTSCAPPPTSGDRPQVVRRAPDLPRDARVLLAGGTDALRISPHGVEHRERVPVDGTRHTRPRSSAAKAVSRSANVSPMRPHASPRNPMSLTTPTRTSSQPIACSPTTPASSWCPSAGSRSRAVTFAVANVYARSASRRPAAVRRAVSTVRRAGPVISDAARRRAGRRRPPASRRPRAGTRRATSARRPCRSHPA